MYRTCSRPSQRGAKFAKTENSLRSSSCVVCDFGVSLVVSVLKSCVETRATRSIWWHQIKWYFRLKPNLVHTHLVKVEYIRAQRDKNVCERFPGNTIKWKWEKVKIKLWRKKEKIFRMRSASRRYTLLNVLVHSQCSVRWVNCENRNDKICNN